MGIVSFWEPEWLSKYQMMVWSLYIQTGHHQFLGLWGALGCPLRDFVLQSWHQPGGPVGLLVAAWVVGTISELTVATAVSLSMGTAPHLLLCPRSAPPAAAGCKWCCDLPNPLKNLSNPQGSQALKCTEVGITDSPHHQSPARPLPQLSLLQVPSATSFAVPEKWRGKRSGQ